jgi:hypothetical protein
LPEERKNPPRSDILLAKTNALDKFFSDHIEEFADSWDLNFVASIKDWQLVKKLRLTPKQERKLEEIYRDYAMNVDYYGFETGGVYDYETYIQ